MNQTKQAGLPQGIIITMIGWLPMIAIVALMPVVPAIRDNFKDIPNINTLAPLVLSAPGLCIAIFSPFAGYLTDKLGRRKLLLIFTLLYGIGGIGPFFVNSFTSLLGGRFILGIGEAFILTVGNTLLGDYFGEKDRSKWIMWQGIVGSGVGPLVLTSSGHLSEIGWNYPFLIYSISFLITGLAYFFIFEPGKKNVAGAEKIQSIDSSNAELKKSSLPLGKFLWIALAAMISSICYFIFALHFALAIESIGVRGGQNIGNYIAIPSFAVPIGAIVYKLMSKKDNNFQFGFLFMLLGLGLLLIGTAFNLFAVISGAFIQQLGAGMTIPVLIAWGLRSVPEEFRGRGMGFWTSGFFLGQFICPLVVSGVKSMVGSLLMVFIVFGIICLIIAIANFLMIGRKPIHL